MTEPANITLRPATAADAPRLAALFSEEGYPAGTSDLELRLERFSQPGSHVVVADAAGEVVGVIAFHLVPRFEYTGTFMRILALVVDAGVRERGLGRQLIGEAERMSREEGAAFFEVTAGHHRPEARQLYEALGYESGVTTYLRKRP